MFSYLSLVARAAIRYVPDLDTTRISNTLSPPLSVGSIAVFSTLSVDKGILWTRELM